MSEKVLGNLLGNLEYVFQGLTFLGVLWLVLKQANISFSVEKSRKMEPMYTSGASVRGVGSVLRSDNGFVNNYGASHEPMSASGYEAPVWHSNAMDLSMINPNELVLAGADRKALLSHSAATDGKIRWVTDRTEPADSSDSEGMNSWKQASRDGMSDLEKALAGGSVAL